MYFEEIHVLCMVHVHVHVCVCVTVIVSLQCHYYYDLLLQLREVNIVICYIKL